MIHEMFTGSSLIAKHNDETDDEFKARVLRELPLINVTAPRVSLGISVTDVILPTQFVTEENERLLNNAFGSSNVTICPPIGNECQFCEQCGDCVTCEMCQCKGDKP